MYYCYNQQIKKLAKLDFKHIKVIIKVSEYFYVNKCGGGVTFYMVKIHCNFEVTVTRIKHYFFYNNTLYKTINTSLPVLLDKSMSQFN